MKLRFSILFLLGLTAVVALFVSKYQHYNNRQTATQTLLFDGGISTVTYGIRRHKSNSNLDCLDFAVIQRDRGVRSQTNYTTIRSHSDKYHNDAILSVGETEIVLPGNTQLHEIVDGKYRTIEDRIPPDLLLGYIASKPKDPSLDTLLEFYAKRRGNGR